MRRRATWGGYHASTLAKGWTNESDAGRLRRLRVFTMWRTSCGDRTLEGAEAAVFVLALTLMRDSLAADDRCEYVCASFDRLTLGQRLTVLCEVTGALLDPTVPPPALSATNEGAIAAVYAQLGASIECDKELCTGTDAQRLVERACRDLGLAESDEIRSSLDHDSEAMWDAVDSLRDRILWDDDYADEEHYVDLDPEAAAVVYGFARTSRDYFLQVPPDPPDSEIAALFQRLDKLLST